MYRSRSFCLCSCLHSSPILFLLSQNVLQITFFRNTCIFLSWVCDVYPWLSEFIHSGCWICSNVSWCVAPWRWRLKYTPRFWNSFDMTLTLESERVCTPIIQLCVQSKRRHITIQNKGYHYSYGPSNSRLWSQKSSHNFIFIPCILLSVLYTEMYGSFYFLHD